MWPSRYGVYFQYLILKTILFYLQASSNVSYITTQDARCCPLVGRLFEVGVGGLIPHLAFCPTLHFISFLNFVFSFFFLSIFLLWNNRNLIASSHIIGCDEGWSKEKGGNSIIQWWQVNMQSKVSPAVLYSNMVLARGQRRLGQGYQLKGKCGRRGRGWAGKRGRERRETRGHEEEEQAKDD